MKLHNTLLRLQDNKLVLDYWTEPKPKYRYITWPGEDQPETTAYKKWRASKQTVEAHESQVTEFEYLAAEEIPDHWSVKSYLKNHSIEIPADRVSIMFAPVYDSDDNCIGNKEYAWVLKQESFDVPDRSDEELKQMATNSSNNAIGKALEKEARQEKFDKILSKVTKEEIEEWLENDKKEQMVNSIAKRIKDEHKKYAHKEEMDWAKIAALKIYKEFMK